MLFFLLLLAAAGFSSGAKAGAPPEKTPETVFLNDRASAVAGAAPLTAPGFVRPEGLTGAGQVVAIADSGLGNGKMADPHPDLKSRPGQMPKVIMLKSWSDRAAADDPDGHGTHLAATVAGTGEASGGRFAGVAPGASIYFQAILGADGRPSPPADLSALFAPAYAAAARIHLDGWGTKGNFYSAGAAQVDAFVRSHPDFLVIFGAGNDGPDPGTLTAEANSKNALVVGASEGARPAFGPGEDNAFEVARFSSRGPAADGRQKPDLVAPGTGIVSAASPLVKSNFLPNPLYTRMQGTSQAAAVTAGAAALLREYFQKEEKIKSPSAALLKAALIAAARPLPGDGAGYGRLDAAAAVIGLKEKTLTWSDEKTPLTQGETRSFTCTVSDRSAPFTAVLAWTDPPAPAGAAKALVNDLDLRVKGPDGKEYLGNDDRRQGVRDDKNNVERVIIPYPAPGTYTVEIRAGALASPQDFALVCGQPPEREIVSGYDARKGTVQFSSGKEAALPPAAARIALGRTLAPALPENVLPGEDAYVTPSGTLYLAAEIFSSRAAQTIPLAGGTLFLEAGTEKREGGFYLRPGATVIANGEKLPGDAPLPAGVPAVAVVTPSAQTIWWVKADYRVKEGVLAAIDLKNRQLTLFNDPQTYRLDPCAAFSFTDTAVDGSRADLPYGAPVAGAAGQLAPGMPVRLVISPKDGLVVYVAARRQLAVGEIKSLDRAAEKITLAEGNTYQVITGAPVLLNGNPADLSGLEPGMNAALLLAGKTVIGVRAEKAVVYGQVVYFSAAEGRLYFLDGRSRLRTFTVPPEAEFFRWWQPGDTGSLLPGEWARLPRSGRGSTWSRIDVAYARPEKSGRLLSYDPATRTVFFSTGDQALVASSSAVTKNGYPVHMEDLLPGEKVDFTLLTVPKSGAAVLGAAKGEAGA
ncbi:MAG: S8 family serine peptidase, partial [Desulfotomaculales bacterium]